LASILRFCASNPTRAAARISCVNFCVGMSAFPSSSLAQLLRAGSGRMGVRHGNSEIPNSQRIRLNLSVGIRKAQLHWALYQGMVLAVPPNWERTRALGPVDPGKAQRLKPSTTEVAARPRPCPDTSPATQFNFYVAHPGQMCMIED
jgi:hypothetical protein